MRPEPARRPRAGVLRPLLVGAALGVAAFAAGSLILYESGGVLRAAGGLAATFAAALAAGVWAGSPGARRDAPPTGRWIAAAVSLGVAGVFATGWTIYRTDVGGDLAHVAALLFLVGFPVYAVGLLLPALIAWERRALDDEDDDGASEGAAGGASVAAVLAGAAAGCAAAGIFLLPSVSPGPLLLATAAFLVFPLLFPRPDPGDDEGAERVLHEEETPFGTLRVTEVVYAGKRQPERRLYQDEEVESGELVRSGSPTFAYIAAAERLLGALSSVGQAYLFLGGGAYTLPRRVAERDPSARITVVELDPAVTRVAQRYFGLRPELGIASVHGDARAVAEGLGAGEFDRVFVDVYDGTEQVPYHLVTAEALAGFRARLRPGGLLVMNVIGLADGRGSRRLWSTARTVRDVFPSVRLYSHLGRDFPDRQNFLVVAALEAETTLPGEIGGFREWPEAEWPQAGTTVLRDRFGGRDGGRPPVSGGGLGA